MTDVDEIDSDRIVSIRCEFGNNNPLFILSVYLPSSSHKMDVFKECLSLDIVQFFVCQILSNYHWGFEW